ncbi:MAG: hypothetical protein AAB263_11310 [Planctomycetota bacterium]
MASYRTALPWSHATHGLLVQAVDDQNFLKTALQAGFSSHQLTSWVNRGDVPATFRAALRALVDDWYHKRSFATNGRVA